MGIPIAKTILCVERNLFLLNFQELKIAKKYELDENLLGCLFNTDRFTILEYSNKKLYYYRNIKDIKAEKNIYS